MNIFAIAHYHYQGTAVPTALFVHNQLQAFVWAGHRVRILVPTPMGKIGENGKRFLPLLHTQVIDGIEHMFLRYPSFSRYGEKGGLNTRNAIWFLRHSLSTVLQDFKPDIIHAHKLGTNTELGSLLQRESGCPLVFTSHGETGCEEPWMHDQTAIKRYANQADTVVCVSSAIRRCMDAAGVSPPLRVILNGFATKHICESAEKQPLSVVQVGHLTTQKRVSITVEAFRRLWERHPGAALTLVGEGPERVALEHQCAVGGLGAAVHFTGQLSNSEVMEELGHSRFFVMPSVHEGFGIAYLEAMASGCVTIGTEGEGIADLIVNGKNGFLVPPDNPQAIVETIEWCLQNPEAADAIAEKGRQDVQNLTWENNAAQYIALFQSLMEGK